MYRKRDGSGSISGPGDSATTCPTTTKSARRRQTWRGNGQMNEAPAVRLSSRNNSNFLIASEFGVTVAVPSVKSVGVPFFSGFELRPLSGASSNIRGSRTSAPNILDSGT